MARAKKSHKGRVHQPAQPAQSAQTVAQVEGVTQPFRMMSLPPEIRNMIWTLIIFSEGSTKIIGGLRPIFKPTAKTIRAVQEDHPPGPYAWPGSTFRHGMPTPDGWRPPRDIGKYAAQRYRGNERYYYDNVTSAEKDLTERLLSQQPRTHPLTPAFTCRAWYNEMTAIYYVNLEHVVPFPYTYRCDEYNVTVASIGGTPQRIPMFEAIGDQNARKIVSITFRHETQRQWGFSQNIWDTYQRPIGQTSKMLLQLMHLVLAEIQLRLLPSVRITNAFENLPSLKLVIEGDGSAVATERDQIIYHSSLKDVFENLPHAVLPTGFYGWDKMLMGAEVPQIRTAAKLGKNHQVYCSRWGELLKKKARLLLRGDDLQEVNEYFKASLIETRKAWSERDKKRNAMVYPGAYLRFFSKGE